MSIGNVCPCGCICHVVGRCGFVPCRCGHAGELWENGNFVPGDISPVMSDALKYTNKLLSEKRPKKKSKSKK